MIRYFAAHPTAANLLMLLLAVIGLAALPNLQRETFPDFTPQEVEVRVVYPGAVPGEVEEAICLRLEDALDSISFVEELRCEAREGIGIAVAKMQSKADFARFLDDVKTEVEAIDNFPKESERPLVRQLGRLDQVVSVAVSGPLAATDLKDYAETLKTRLQALPNVSQVSIEGFSDRQFRILIPEHELRQYGLTITDIAATVGRQNIRRPAGGVETREREWLLRVDQQGRSVQELAELLVIGTAAGTEIRLGDIAEIEERFELDEEKLLFDGRRAARLNITKTKNEDTLSVVDAVSAFIEQERLRAPPGVELALTRNVSSIVRDRLQMLVTNGWQGLLLVFVSLWLFFHLRFAFWVVMGLPVSFLGGLFFMSLFGYSINMLTMVALLIALGLLMDDAIVLSENIATHLRRGKSALNAAIDGTSEVAAGVLASFLTTAAVFTPLAFLEGDIGKVLKVIPVVLLLVLAVSLIEAFFILPHHLAKALQKHRAEDSAFRRRFEALLEHVRSRYVARAAIWAVHRRYLFAGLIGALFLVSLGMLAGGHLKFRAFPAIDGDVIEARVLLPQGTPLWRTEAVVEQLLAALRRVDEEFTPLQAGGERLLRHISVQYAHNPDAYESGPHVATISVDLLTAERRNARIDDLFARWREQAGVIPDAIAVNFKEPQIGPAGLALEIRLQGDDLARLQAASLDLRNWLQSFRGVLDLSDDLRPGKPELRLQLREGALALGFQAAAVAEQLQAAFQGITAGELQIGSEAYEIDLQLSAIDQADSDALYDFPISAPNGSQVPLGEIAVLQQNRGYARIQRIDSLPTVTIQGDVDDRRANAAQIIAATEQQFLPQLRARYPGINVLMEGQNQEAATTGASLRRGFLLGLIGIFILLSFQFRSFIEPLTVMAIIPLALIGVVWGHWLLGLDLSMPSIMGFVSLAGIVVNDSILLVEFLKMRTAQGMATTDAAIQAARERFRAVLLTSLTTIAGLLPLLAEKSLQAQILIPLVTSIVFGLLATTLLVLLLVPALYGIIDDFRSAKPAVATP